MATQAGCQHLHPHRRPRFGGHASIRETPVPVQLAYAIDTLEKLLVDRPELRRTRWCLEMIRSVIRRAHTWSTRLPSEAFRWRKGAYGTGMADVRLAPWRIPPTLAVAVAMIATPAIVRAQTETPEVETPPGTPPHDSEQQQTPEESPGQPPSPAATPRGPAERMAAGMAPFDLPVFGLGAALTLSTPGSAFGVGSISATYDLGPVHFDALFGLVWGDAGPSSLSGGLRGFVLLHRGPIGDFSLGAGGSLGYIERVDGSTDITWQVTAGAKMRAFIGGKNVAVTATIGVGVSFVDESGVVLVGGRLLGSAGFVYFFR